jgi:hypothetical protein
LLLKLLVFNLFLSFTFKNHKIIHLFITLLNKSELITECPFLLKQYLISLYLFFTLNHYFDLWIAQCFYYLSTISCFCLHLLLKSLFGKSFFFMFFILAIFISLIFKAYMRRMGWGLKLRRKKLLQILIESKYKSYYPSFQG